ncbi:MAG: murein L,D-transpeptidase catalytic domain family protein [Chitinispirillia bacterium]|nr:murein L,D-transpeptidase catalytic domain family protein [Chitinispirillia bacterium]
MIKYLSLSFLVILAIISTAFIFSQVAIRQAEAKEALLSEKKDVQAEEEEEAPVLSEETRARIEEKAKEALAFCESNDCSTEFCILIDKKIHSGKYRMFVYDFNRQEIEHMALSAHGIGKGETQSTNEQPLFSNEPGSLLTSLGKYKTGERAYSNWGINIHYKLHGLEASNSNAFRRIVVLHSYTPLSASEIYPYYLPLGWSYGCPVTDDETMRYLDVKLQNSKKPALLWIYY